MLRPFGDRYLQNKKDNEGALSAETQLAPHEDVQRKAQGDGHQEPAQTCYNIAVVRTQRLSPYPTCFSSCLAIGIAEIIAKNRHSFSPAASKPGAGFDAAGLREWRFFDFWGKWEIANFSLLA